MHRFFVPLIDVTDGQGFLDGEAARQIARVLRLRNGQRIGLFDGSGSEQIVEITAIGDMRIDVRVELLSRPLREPPVSMTLCMALIQHSRFEFVLQKATELGVAAIQPLTCDRTRSSGAERVTPERMRRWKQIVREATEQSGRVVLPKVRDPEPVEAIFATDGQTCTLVLDPTAAPRNDLHTADIEHGVRLIIGPEGGWSPDESRHMTNAGAIGVRLGPRTLRAETAAISALAVVMAQVEAWQLCVAP